MLTAPIYQISGLISKYREAWARARGSRQGLRRRPVIFPLMGIALVFLGLFFGWIALEEAWDPWLAGSVTLAGVLAGVFTAQASSWVFTFSPAFFVSASFLLVSDPMPNSLTSMWFAIAAVIGASHSAFALTPSWWSVLTRPRLRWWYSAERAALDVRVRVCPVTGGEFLTRTLDISETGAFLSLEAVTVSAPRHRGTSPANVPGDPVSEFQPGVHCSIRLELNQYTAFTCSARVVRREKEDFGSRSGAGIVFVGLTGLQRRRLIKYLKAAKEEFRLRARKPAPSASVSQAQAA